MPTQDVILLVNDIPDHAISYARALASHGFRVQLARSGMDALQLARQTKPDCAVIDLRLPDMSGWELCSELKHRAGDKGLRIVVLTPDLSKMCATNSVAHGCDAWLAHPTVAEDLVRTVKRVLKLETTAPQSPDHALLDLKMCGACGSNRVRPTLRLGLIQYYCCQACAFCWRVDVLVPATSG
jgi:CheY-like chemotaxis protein